MDRRKKGLKRRKRRLATHGSAEAQYQRINADDLIRWLTAAKPTRSFCGYEIVGKLDLSRRTIDTAIELRCCTFRDNVELSYCEFTQAVNFSGSTFCGEFNSGKDPEVHTIYRKDLICNGTLFEKDIYFTGARVEGDVYFSRDPSECAPYENTVFSGAVTFRAFKCNGNAKFEGARFESSKVADFRSARFGGQLNCTNTVFRGPVMFNDLNVGGAAYFTDACFLRKEPVPDLPDITSASEEYAVSFRHASFERHLVCQNTSFMGPVSFNSVQCKSTGFFQNMLLEGGSHNFRYASFEGNLRCDCSTFKGKGEGCAPHGGNEDEISDFRYVNVGSNFSLARTYFETEVNMGHASVSQKLSLEGSCFKKRIKLYDANIGILELLNVNPPTDIEIRDSENVYDRDFVNLPPIAENEHQSHGIFGKMNLVYRRLTGLLSKRQREQRASTLADELCPWTQNRPVEPGQTFYSPDLTGTTFARFHGGRYEPLERELALKLVAPQLPATFSRDPYLQLEEFYRRTGNETKARNIYRRGRKDLRKNAKDRNSSIRWNWSRNLTDWLWKWVTGYGVDIWRLLLIAGVVILFGILMFQFCATESVAPFCATDNVVQDNVVQDNVVLVRVKPVGGQESPNLLLYSLDLFLPLVNLNIDNKWAPNGPVLQIYAVVHALIGWLIVPLIVAALAGIMRR
jgi:uncharacterized protein YjbI with pentapeptide repeats